MPKYSMVLFVAGNENNSHDALINLKKICDKYLDGSCEVEVVDVLTDYRRALENRVLITPTLLVLSPPPPVRIVGSLGDQCALETALHLNPAS